jgi:hypothetical protein
MKMKTIVIAIVCLLAGYIAGQAGKVHQVRTVADEVAQDILHHCDVAIEKNHAECDDRVAAAIQDTSDATLAACERKIDEITDASDDAVSTCEILLEEAKAEYKKAYDAGFNDCQAQF